MNMNRWTDEQTKAITASGCSVIVSAAAGSGKTSVLVERLLRIISNSNNKIPVEKMVVVTFTNDAAAEMKQRLSDSIAAFIQKDPGNKWLARQYSMIGSAAISTIHSFCFDLIRNNVTQLNISSDFRIIDETEENLFRNEVLKNILEKFYKEKPECIKLLSDNFCSGNNDTPIENLILNVYKNVSSIPFFKNWLKIAFLKYDTNLYKNFYTKYLTDNFNQAENLLNSAKEKAEQIENTKLMDMLIGDNILLKEIKEAVFKGDTSMPFPKIKFATFPRFPKSSDHEEDRILIKTFRDSMIDIVKKVSPIAYEVLAFEKSDMLMNKQIIEALTSIIIEFDSELRKYKDRKNSIGFDDAEQLALELLAECDDNGNVFKKALAEELSDYYKIIMVDEFQDSNNRQDMIFRLLSHNGNSAEYGSNLFFVGDVKQSIYRFRLANPDNFINAVEKSVPYCEGEKTNSYIKLNKNFRSSAEVINFVNNMFSRIMFKETGDIDYNENEYLIRGAEFYPADRNTEIIMYNKTNLPENAEAACIAEKISEMIEQRHPVSINGGKSFRSCEMRDFCILKRTNTNNDTYIKELEKRGLNVECEESKGYLKSREVSVLINLLRVIDNPMNDLALVSVMMSPMFALSADDVSVIRLVNAKGYIYNNMVSGLGINNSEPSFDDNLCIKAKFVYDTIQEMRLFSSVYTVQELIQRIYDNTDFLSVMQLYKDSEKKKANLRLLLEYAGSFESNSNEGLSGFIKYIDRILERNDDFRSASASASSINAVSVKTMHKSKGLEFPFVFIAETTRKFNRMDETNPYQFSYKMGLGFIGQNRSKYERFKTLPFEAIKIYNHKCSIAEEMRLLYVALTRAKEKLFITFDISENRAKKAALYTETMKSNNGITSFMISDAACMNDWIMMTLLSFKKNSPLREQLGIYEYFSYEDYQDVNFSLFNKSEDETEFKEKDTNGTPQADLNYVKKLEQMINLQYDFRYSELTAKLSVSDITKKSNDYKLQLKRPKFDLNRKGLTNAEKGTALHKFLQFTDLKKLESGIESELERLYNYGYLSVTQRDSIKINDIRSFLESNLFKRIKNCSEVIREKKFLVSLNDLDIDDEYGNAYRNTDGMLNGIIDMILVEDDSLVLVDYKTDRINDINLISNKYRGQLTLYKRTLEKIQSLPVKEAIIYSFYKKMEVKVL